MTEVERYQHLLHSRLSVFSHRVQQAKAVIAAALALPEAKRFYVAFSGGVDSLVVLDLVRQSDQGRRLQVFWGDDGWDFPETLHFLAACEKRYNFRLHRVRSLGPWQDWCNELGRLDAAHDPDLPGVWGNPRHWDATAYSLTKYAPAHSYTGVFLGLLGKQRKEGGESTSRWHILHGGSRPLYQVQAEQGMWHCSPLASWTKQDVWAYVVSKGLAYNPVYDTLAELGIPFQNRRVAPLTCFRVLQYGSHTYLKTGWPELWNSLCVVFPAVRSYG